MGSSLTDEWFWSAQSNRVQLFGEARRGRSPLCIASPSKINSNGAGKTTTLNAVAGLVPLAAGEIRFRGAAIGVLQPHAVVARGIALSPEGWRLFVGQTVEQNLRLGATTLSNRRRVPDLLERVLALFPRLEERRRQSAGALSGGKRQMLALGRALMSDPSLLLLDEPSLGLAPAVIGAMYETLDALRREGLTLLIAEQSVELPWTSLTEVM